MQFEQPSPLAEGADEGLDHQVLLSNARRRYCSELMYRFVLSGPEEELVLSVSERQLGAGFLGIRC